MHVLVIIPLCCGISSSTVSYPLFVLFFFVVVCLFARFGDVSIVLWYFFFSGTYSFSARLVDVPVVLRYFYFSVLFAATKAKTAEEEVVICYKKLRSHEERPKVVVFLSKMLLGLFPLKGLFLFVAFLNASSGQPIATCNNCCRRENHKEIDNSRRSVRSQWKWGQTPLCDKNLPQGWYRFKSFVGGQMPTQRVSMNRCGTMAPMHAPWSRQPCGSRQGLCESLWKKTGMLLLLLCLDQELCRAFFPLLSSTDVHLLHRILCW